MIRVVLPEHLRTLARIDGEVTLEVAGPATQRTVLDARVSNSRPEMGFVKFMYELVNQNDEPVMTLTSPAMLGRRAAARAAS